MKLRNSPSDRGISELLSFGVINVDKPPGPSSHQISAWVRDMIGVEKAAHTGTLDPKVTGSLPVLLGDATRLSEILLGKKEYIVVLEIHKLLKNDEDLKRVLENFIGDIYQKPPKKSAVSRSLRVREIEEIELIDYEKKRALLRVRCASGTYIRKLCHDIGLVLGSGGHMGDLRRTMSFPFTDKNLVKMHELVDAIDAWKNDGEEDELRNIVLPGEVLLEGIPKIIIAESAAKNVAKGSPIYAPGIISIEMEKISEDNNRVACYTPNGAVVCLGRYVGGMGLEKEKIVELERVLV
tara:strand:+ start:165 stop:1049 length:885 start_codon:yes stop_codon:yes gene_type:complete